MSAKTIRQLGFQGDLACIRVDALPDDATPCAAEDGVHVVAHSETGHHHTVDATAAGYYTTPDPMIGYLVLDQGTPHVDIVHHRAWDTHATVRLLAEHDERTVWQLRRQREYTPWGNRMVVD